MQAVGYIRAFRGERADGPVGLEAQRSAIGAEGARRGWTITEIVEDPEITQRAPGRRNLLPRAFWAALAAARAQGADALVVSHLDRLIRPSDAARDYADRVRDANREHLVILALDLDLDMTTPAGRKRANVLPAFWKARRRRIGGAVRAGLATTKAQGVPIGRPSTIPLAVASRIVAERAAGRGLQAIADGLMADGIPTVQGGVRWYPSTIRKVLMGETARRLPAD